MSRLVQLVRSTIHHTRHARRGDPPPEVVAQRAALARSDFFTHVHEGA